MTILNLLTLALLLLTICLGVASRRLDRETENAFERMRDRKVKVEAYWRDVEAGNDPEYPP